MIVIMGDIVDARIEQSGLRDGCARRPDPCRSVAVGVPTDGRSSYDDLVGELASFGGCRAVTHVACTCGATP